MIEAIPISAIVALVLYVYGTLLFYWYCLS
jgi:hypothetical protein